MRWGAAALLCIAPALAKLRGCDDGITCCPVVANSLTFDCRFAHPSDTTRDAVILLHGFPEWSSMWMPLMRELDAAGYRAAACNQRGYSPLAAPDEVEAYDYRLLAADVWAIADSLGFDTFHMVAHDHGAVLGWTLAASDAGASRILSYSALSIPHIDAFSSGLVGDGADPAQQIASQYFSMFMLPDSASLNFDFWYLTLGATSTSYARFGEYFGSAKSFQKALWWYNGASLAGVMAMPPNMSVSELTAQGAYSTAALRAMYPGQSDEPDGWPATSPSGVVSVPSLYICGSKDSSILCNHDYALRTEEYIAEGFKYTYLEVDCGHDLTSPSCSEHEKVYAAIIAHIQDAMIVAAIT